MSNWSLTSLGPVRLSERPGLVRLLVVAATICLVVALSGASARAQTIGPGSCQTTDGSVACAPDNDLASVGVGSCDGFASPCSQDPALTSVGAGSCNNGDAYDPYSNCTGDPVLASVKDNSCDSESSCDDAATLVSVGSGSCNSQLDACNDASVVGDDSCNNTSEFTNCGSVGPVGNGSCDGNQACDGVQGSVGDASCDGLESCGGTGGVTGNVGEDSCNGQTACDGVAGVGDYSCNGDFTCDSASGTVGTCADNTVAVTQCDPAAVPAAESGLAPPGWNATQVTVVWNWSSGPDGAALPAATASNCPTSSESSGQGTIVLTASCTDENGNAGTATYTVNVDTSGLTDAPFVDGTRGANGWYRTPVSVTWNWTDSLSGVQPSACTQASGTGVQEGVGIVVSSSCEDNAGGTAADELSFNVDTIAPTVTFTGNAGSYRLLQKVDIGCIAADNTGGSGVAASPCAKPLADAAAWTFGLGTHTLSAAATDVAGNTTSPAATTSFTVAVGIGSLCTLTTDLVQGSARYKALSALQKGSATTLAKALCSVLARVSPGSGAPPAATPIRAYDLGIESLADQALLTGAQVAALQSFAAALQ